MFNTTNETVAQTVRRLLDRGYNQTAGRVLESVVRSTTAEGTIIQTRLSELEAEAARLAEMGSRLRPDNAVVRALVADLGDVMERNAGRVDGVSDDLVLNAAETAGAVTRQLALPNFDSVSLNAAGIRWNEPSAEAVAELVGFVDSPAWADELARLGVSVPETVRSQVIRGFAEGMTPARLASILRDTVETLPRYEADRAMRTLQLQSYRGATATHQNANVGIIDRVTRVAALDGRTCLACIALSGTVIWDREQDAGTPIPRIDDHHFGRCFSVTTVGGVERDIPVGTDWFETLSEPQKLAQMGHANYEAYKAGRVQLRDFVGTREDKVFGEMVVEKSLKGVLGDEAREFYK